MAMTAYLASQNINSTSIETKALCVLEPLNPGFKIAKMQLTVTGVVPGIDDARFGELAREAEKTCPVSNALRGSVEITLDAHLG
jgi:osmotically inducible protein OsmC